jgi:general secretion pathway protein G
VFQRAMQKRASGEGGFTLIELLIVIVILGILATIVVFAVGGVTDKGDAAACKADKKTLETAVEAFRAQTGAYPADEAALVPKFLHQQSEKYNYTAGSPLSTDPGTIAPAGGSGCT